MSAHVLGLTKRQHREICIRDSTQLANLLGGWLKVMCKEREGRAVMAMQS
jgi:hypothetical protein